MRHPREPRRTPDRLAHRPTWLLGRAAARSSALLAAAFAAEGGGLRGYDYRLLAALAQWGPSSQADLGRDAGIDASDVTASVVELERRGLVRRRPDDANQRRKIVTITTAGDAMLARLDELLDHVQDALLAPLTDEQRLRFGEIMTALAGDGAGGTTKAPG
jgi:MarR family transcriptional regulator, lower aerobic nicotinate degradation pathway regulator